jgi:hypothetical protein
MSEKAVPPERFSLSRWSRRKLEATAEASVPPSAAPNAMANAVSTAPAGAPPAGPAAAVELPSVDSLNFDSDFTAFLRPEVDEKLKRAALKRLLRDPRFNVMDGLDTYIDDYTKADPIEPSVLKEMLQRFSAVASTSTPAAEATEVAPARPVQSNIEGPVLSNVEGPEAPTALDEAPARSAAPLPAASAEPSSFAEDLPEESPPPHSPS